MSSDMASMNLRQSKTEHDTFFKEFNIFYNKYNMEFKWGGRIAMGVITGLGIYHGYINNSIGQLRTDMKLLETKIQTITDNQQNNANMQNLMIINLANEIHSLADMQRNLNNQHRPSWFW